MTLQGHAPSLGFARIAATTGILLVSPLAGAQPNPASPGGPSLTIRAAIERALARNPLVQRARERLRETDAFTGSAVAPSLPQVSLGGAMTYKKDALNVGNPAFGGDPYNHYDVNLRFTQSVYSGGSLLSLLGEARKEKDARGLDTQVVERDLSVRVIEAYYGILLGQRRAATYERTREVEKEVLEVARHRQRIGRSQYLDVLQIQTQLALLEPRIAQARNSIRAGAAELAQLLGEEEAQEFRLPDRLDAVDGEALVRQTRTGLPELEKAAILREQFEYRRDTAGSKFLPRLDLVGVWGRGAYVKTDLLDAYSTYWNLGVQVSVPIFSGLASVHERRQLASQAAQLEIDEARVREERSLEQIRARQNLEVAVTVAKSSEQAYALAEKSLAEARRTYRLATTDYQQFLSTQQSYLDALFALDQARYDSIVAAARYCAASGVALSELVNLLENGK